MSDSHVLDSVVVSHQACTQLCGFTKKTQELITFKKKKGGNASFEIYAHFHKYVNIHITEYC